MLFVKCFKIFFLFVFFLHFKYTYLIFFIMPTLFYVLLFSTLPLYSLVCVWAYLEMGREKQPCVELAHHGKAPLISQTAFKKRHIYTYIWYPEKSYYIERACPIVKSLSVPSRKHFPQYGAFVVTSLFQSPPYNVVKPDRFINLLWAFGLKMPFSTHTFPRKSSSCELICFYITNYIWCLCNTYLKSNKLLL